ncbi:MAG TPA: sulfurtransferase [Arenimonas sp.]|uniref:sulfurtransferase n=1 Tax=Arenimonas sp. TaxID=1872635 RepID=UPI002BD9DD5B|nr:sulfurtransferase [Arenimonas sp.]HMB58115.1 sulfurtransferase [Arenimonas sp.]
MNWTTLVSSEQLVAALAAENLRLVDCRFVLAGADADAGETAWRVSHLPGAGYAHLDRDLSDHHKPASEGRHPLPDAAAFCATLERLGISADSQVVAYDAGDGAMAAARFWWLLKLLGHERVAVLDGGFARWQALDLPLESTMPIVAPGSYVAQYDEAQIARIEDLLQLETAGNVCALDARAPERYRGEVEPLDKAAGHIPGALNRPYSANLRDGRFKPAADLRAEFSALISAHAPAEVVLYCGSGVTACHNLLAMEYAGLHGARIFPPSWSGWISDGSRAIARG